MKIGIPCMKCSLRPSQQVNKKTGKSAKTCGVSSAWKEMNDERMGRDTTIDKNLTHNNVWMDGSTTDDVTKTVQEEIDKINEERRANGLRAMRKDAVSVIEIVEKPPIDYMQHLSYEEKCRFLSDSHDTMKELLYTWNPQWKMIESVQHHDEFGGLSAHNHSLVLLSSKDKNGIATMNAKAEFNLKFFNYINKNYPERMRSKGYDIEDCKTYDRLSEEEKEQRRLHPEEHGVEAYKYKQKKQAEMTKKLSERQNELESVSKSLEMKQKELSETKKEIGDLREDKERLQKKMQETVEAKALYETKTERAIQAEKEYGEKIRTLTAAPSVASYEDLLQENQKLQTEVSMNDASIQKLQEERDQLREIAEHWKKCFSDIAHKLGSKLMSFAGYDVSGDLSVKEYPDKEIAAKISDMKESLEERDPKQYRVLPDNKEKGKFRVAYRQKDGSLETVKSGFDSRDQADKYRRNIINASKGMGEEMDRTFSHKMS